MSFRRWLAWKLQQLAVRIHDTEFHQLLSVYAPDGRRIVEWDVYADGYGAGVSSQDTHGCPSGYRVGWEDIDFEEWCRRLEVE